MELNKSHYFGIGVSGQLQDSFEAKVTGNDVLPIRNDSHVKDRTTILNYPAEAKKDENYPAESADELPDCPKCGRCEWEYKPNGDLVCPCGNSVKGGSG